MARVNDQGYVERNTHSGKKNPSSKGTKRNWWLVKCCGHYGSGIHIHNNLVIMFPKRYLGKRIRLKVEVLE